MVLIHIKRESHAKNTFLFEATVGMTVDELIKELVEVHNMRLKCQRLAVTCKELAKHGPIRPEETRGLSDASTKMTELDINAYGKPTNPDDHGYRTGCPPPGETADVMLRTAEEVAASVDANLVDQKKCIDKIICKRGLDNLYGATMIAYPAFHKLPNYDPARLELENKEELDGKSDMQDILDVNACSMWWAGKELVRGKTLGEYVGKNEKTKIVARLCPTAAGAPVREPRIDEATHKAMLSYYYKKQEEDKKLRENDDDSYLDAKWADPKALKKQLVGSGPMRY